MGETPSASVDRIRVLWLIKGLGRGGAEQLLVSTARSADHQRFAYETCFVLPHKNALVGVLESSGVPVRPALSPPGGLGRWMWPWRLRQVLSAGHYDVIHAHSPVAAVVARVATRSLRRPRPVNVYTQHNVWPSYAWLTRVADHGTCALDDHRFAVSSAVARSAPRGVSSRSELLLHGISIGDLSRRRRPRHEVRAALALEPEAPLVLTVANLRSTKGYPTLLAAARLVADERPDTRFVIVGDGPLRQELESERDRLRLAEVVRFLGTRSDVPDLLAAADLFTLASRHEGLPIAMMEAMAAGLPCVLTTVGGIPDAVREGDEALLVPPDSPAELAEALLVLLGDPVGRARMSACARKGSERFDISTAVRRYERVYRELAS